MVLSKFEMLQGAAGDVKELEYISCLHQTDLMGGIRKNASIQPIDVQLFLLSRYGISVTISQVRNAIFSGLQADTTSSSNGGDADAEHDTGNNDTGDDDHAEKQQDETCMDLMEIVAILLIPTLLKASVQECCDGGHGNGLLTRNYLATHGVISAPKNMLEFVLHMILQDVTGNKSDNDDSSSVNNNNKPLLTKDLIRSILVAYGEYQLAMDEDLLSEMIQTAATSCGGGSGGNKVQYHHGCRNVLSVEGGNNETARQDNCLLVFNVKTFAQALTNDVQLYDLRNETRITTNLDDVFLTQKVEGNEHQHYVDGKTTGSQIFRKSLGHKKKQDDDQQQLDDTCIVDNDNNNDDDDDDVGAVDDDEDNDFDERIAKSRDIQRINTAPSIDMTAGTYRSKGLVAALWSTIVLTYFCYSAQVFSNIDWNCEDTASYSPYYGHWNVNFFGCSLGQIIAQWLFFFFTMSTCGVVFVSLGSLGNSTAESKQVRWPLFGLTVVLMITILPPLLLKNSGNADHEEVPEESSHGVTLRTLTLMGISGDVIQTITVLMGTTTAVFHVAHVLVLIGVPSHAWLEGIHKAGQWITRNSAFAEVKMKRAAALKLATLTQNALNIVQTKHEKQNHIIDTHYGQALKNYEKYGKVYVRAGGFQWAWNLLVTGKALSDNGIWLPARVFASNIAQFIIALYILLAGIALTRYTWNNNEETKIAMHDYMNQFIADSENSLVDNDIMQELMNNFAIGATNHSLNLLLGCDDFPIIANGDEMLITSYCSPQDMMNGSSSLDCILNQTERDAALLNVCPLLLNSSTVANYSNGIDLLLADAMTNLSQVYLNAESQKNIALLHYCPLLDNSSTDIYLNSSDMYLNSTDRAIMTNLSQAYFIAASEQSLDYLYPAEKYMVVIPMIIWTVVSFTMAMYLAVTYLPSVLITFLQFRCGYIPSLYDKEFAFYRHAQDQVSILTGSLFWGTLVSSILVGSIIAFIAFLLLWQVTVYFAQRLTAILVGILCVFVIRVSCLCVCRGSMYQAFYRTKPRAANYSMLALEWANLALSVWFVFMRMIKLLIVAGAYIGKIDSDFLAEGVGKIGPLLLDGIPKIHRKDILCHEAHRHPYMEQLGVMYMMKLRYPVHFGNRAGSCWRLIFVHALMPWLHRYRVLARPEKKKSERLHFSRIKSEHPELQFVSLRNTKLDVDLDEEEYHDCHENNRGHTEHDDNYGHGHGDLAAELWQAAVVKHPELVAKYGEYSRELLMAMLNIPIFEQESSQRPAGYDPLKGRGTNKKEVNMDIKLVPTQHKDTNQNKKWPTPPSDSEDSMWQHEKGPAATTTTQQLSLDRERGAVANFEQPPKKAARAATWHADITTVPLPPIDDNDDCDTSTSTAHRKFVRYSIT